MVYRTPKLTGRRKYRNKRHRGSKKSSNLEMLAALANGSRGLRPDTARVQGGTTRICPMVVSL